MDAIENETATAPQSGLKKELCEGVLILTLNRPEKFNALNVETLEALIAAFDAAAGDRRIRAIMLTGAGKAFCAGQDLGDRSVAPGQEAPDLGQSLQQRYNPLVRKMRNLPKPIVCAVNGVAAGAGANIALAADIVLAARSAKFIQAFAKLGLIPDSGGTWMLPRLVGEARARALALLAEPIGAEQAHQWGMIYRVVDDAALRDEAFALARQLAQGPTYGYGLIKKALSASATKTFDEHLDLERDFQRLAGASSDYGEGVSAFMEKRAPQFSGVCANAHALQPEHEKGQWDGAAVAAECARLMWNDDRASAAAGMKIVTTGPGTAALSMEVTSAMTNGHGDCHGGFIFMLADSAFAFACNSYNQRCVAQHCSITYLAPAKLGMILIATAIERQRAGRNGVYDVCVKNDAGETIAEFRGHSRTIAGTFF